MGGPPDKDAKFKLTKDTTSDEVSAALDNLAEEGFTGAIAVIPCADGTFVFVRGYK